MYVHVIKSINPPADTTPPPEIPTHPHPLPPTTASPILLFVSSGKSRRSTPNLTIGKKDTNLRVEKRALFVSSFRQNRRRVSFVVMCVCMCVCVCVESMSACVKERESGLRFFFHFRCFVAIMPWRFQGEVGGWGRDPKKCTGRDWGMGSSTI